LPCIREIAGDLGIALSNLKRWYDQYRKRGELAFPGHGKENLTPQEEENRRLQRELNDVRQERDILKKPWPSSPRNRRPATGLFGKMLINSAS